MESAASFPVDSESKSGRLSWYQLRWVLYASPVILLIATAWEYSFPDVHFAFWMFLTVCWPLLCLGWLVYVVMRSVHRKSVRWLRPRNAVIPVAALIALALVFTSAPFEARFRLSRPSMDADATRIIREPKLAKHTDRIGSWKAEQVETFDGGMRFLIPDIGFLDPVGFAYSVKGEPPNLSGEDIYYRQSENWWVWQESW